ncbi:MFS transporter [Archangium sp.]|uniref:MFS transporter n=1 Tax=Archangium sp. TaxID=1872627 RepID=UPI002D229E13|nr:MFS transporter [Archangium sp.]HYO59608.1 MFS transporter [Archangium sp.]
MHSNGCSSYVQGPVPLSSDRRSWLAVLVVALGYFVDMFDLVMFSILRIPSLRGIGVTDPEQLALIGKQILDLQLLGMLFGGVAFGVAGDRLGRTRTLFASIALYSIANVLNAFVTSVEQYGVLRFVAGFGLAGELGAGITLVGELLPTAVRGIGTTIVASVGLLGSVAAGFIAELLDWKTCYLLGGGFGIVLLFMRIGVVESGMFERMSSTPMQRGNPLGLLWPSDRLVRFLCIVLCGMPIWFAAGVIFVFAPELGQAMGIPEPIHPGRTIGIAYAGTVVGDILSGSLSQLMRSRKYIIALFLVALAVSIVVFVQVAPYGPWAFYSMIFIIGAATGYWVVFVTTASELFGTNLRATAATSAPNVVRGLGVVITSIWFALKPGLGTLPATLTLGLVCCAIGLVSALSLRETFHRDLDFHET